MMIFRLSTSYLLNIGGAALPLFIALITVPIYVSHIGDARYGVMSLIWLMLGYFGFLDLGLSRAAANALARLREAPQTARAQVLVTTIVLNLVQGCIGAMLLFYVGTYIVDHFLRVSPLLRPELLSAFPFIVGLFPLALLGGVAIGALESQESFLHANIIQATGSCLGQLIPMAVAVEVSPSLSTIVPIAVAIRGVTVIVSFVLVLRMEGPLSLADFRFEQAGLLLRYGGWITVSGLVSPFLTSLDQFIIGSTLSVAAVTYYAVPMNLVMRSQIIATALERTVFPRLSHLPESQAKALAQSAALGLSQVLFPLLSTGIFLINPFLKLWLGPDFASKAHGIGEILLVGAFINALAYMPGALIQARGRPHLTAIFHCSEVLPYFALLYTLSGHFGLKGVAIAWVIRVLADTILMYIFAGIVDGASALRLMSLAALMIFAALIRLGLDPSLIVTVCLIISFLVFSAFLDLAFPNSVLRRLVALLPKKLFNKGPTSSVNQTEA